MEKLYVNEKSLTDDLPVCPATGAGFATNLCYKEDGTRQKVHKIYDRSFHCQQTDTRTCLYLICSGLNGFEIAEYAVQKITAEILFGQLNNNSAIEVKEALRQAFVSAEKDYIESINEFLAEKTELQCQIPENISQYDVINTHNYEDILNRLIQINKNLTVGSSVASALIYNTNLYIANIGNCRVLLCKTDEHDAFRVNQLSVDHNLYNEDEELRLSQLGVDIQAMRQGSFESTRCIGCYAGKAGYKDSLYLSGATSEPVDSQPEIIGPIALDESCRFLVIMSTGLCKAMHEIYPGKPNDINRSLVQLIIEQFRSESTLAGVSQSVIHKIVQMHHDAYMRFRDDSPFHGREDITLLVRNFNYPMPNAIQRNENLMQFSPKLPKATTSSNKYFSTSDSNKIIQSLYSTSSSTSSVGSIATIDTNKRIKSYVDFSDYYKNVEEAKKKNSLDPSINFD